MKTKIKDRCAAARNDSMGRHTSRGHHTSRGPSKNIDTNITCFIICSWVLKDYSTCGLDLQELQDVLRLSKIAKIHEEVLCAHPTFRHSPPQPHPHVLSFVFYIFIFKILCISGFFLFSFLFSFRMVLLLLSFVFYIFIFKILCISGFFLFSLLLLLLNLEIIHLKKLMFLTYLASFKNMLKSYVCYCVLFA